MAADKTGFFEKFTIHASIICMFICLFVLTNDDDNDDDLVNDYFFIVELSDCFDSN